MSDKPQQAKCKACGAEVIYRYTPAGNLMPLDAKVHKRGLIGMYWITNEQDCAPAAPMFDPIGTEYHTSHFDTCPHADQFRSRPQ